MCEEVSVFSILLILDSSAADGLFEALLRADGFANVRFTHTVNVDHFRSWAQQMKARKEQILWVQGILRGAFFLSAQSMMSAGQLKCAWQLMFVL